MHSTAIGFHIYGTGTEEGYRTVCCSDSVKHLALEIDRICMRLGGNSRIEAELATQRLTVSFLANGQVLVSLWRPSPVPDSRNRPNPMEAASAVFDYSFLQRCAFPLNQLRNFLGGITRQASPAPPPFSQEAPDTPSSPDLLCAREFCNSGRYDSGVCFKPNSARWIRDRKST